MRAFRRVIELAPSHVEARLNLARLQQELGREAEALRTLSHVNKDALDEVNASEMNEFQGLVSVDRSHVYNTVPCTVHTVIHVY